MKKMLLSVIVVLLVGIAAAAVYAVREMGAKPSAEEVENFAKLPYFKDGEFQSPEKLVYDFDNVRNGPAGFLRFLSRSPFAPDRELPTTFLTKESFAEKPADFALYWLGHASVLTELAGRRILFDPVFGNAAPIPFAVPRYGKAPVEAKDLPPIDYVVITHNHYDHLERKTVLALKDAHFIVPLGVVAALRGWGVDAGHITELGWGDDFAAGGIKIVAETAVHYSGRGLGDRNKTLWNSYIIEGAGKKIYWVGDSGYGSHFAEIGQKYGPFDLVTIEIDGWNTGWPNTHLFPDEAVKAAGDLKAKQILPLHWAVFDLALHPWHESIDMVLEKAQKTGLDVLTPKIGDKIVPGKTRTEKWW